MQPLEGQRVVVTGAAGGIGTLVAQRLRARGARVVGIDRVPCPACDESIVGDLSAPEGVAAIAAGLGSRPVDVLVNLAGIQYFGPFERQDAQSVWLGFAVNLIAPVVLSQAVLPQMRARNAGQIVNIGSVFGAIPFAHFVTYSSAKGGLRGFSDALRRELNGSGIRVTHIAPRAVRTAFNSQKVLEFAALTRMNMDAPELVADRIAMAVGSKVSNIVIGIPENIFVRVNALLPALVDLALKSNDRKAAALFQ
ncbi:MAG: SDR family NAD(P)-dependent oxidoreductase [Pseudomonadota bacterium]